MAFSHHPAGLTEWEFGGSIPGTAGSPAFASRIAAPSDIPVVIAVPHAGRVYPQDLLDAMRNPGSSAMRLEDRYVDLLAERIAAVSGAAIIKAFAPRAMIDLNRSPDDVDWAMVGPGSVQALRPPQPVAPSRRARSGLGLVPRRLPGQGELWRGKLAPAALEQRLSGIHRPYHDRLAAMLGQLARRWGAALLIDLHSMPPLVHGPAEAAQIIVGDRFGATCDGRLVAEAFDWLGAQAVRLAHNHPYAGGYGLDRHAAAAAGVYALQLEIDRSCYLDSRLAEPGPGLEPMAELIGGLVRQLAPLVADLGQARLGSESFVPDWLAAAE